MELGDFFSFDKRVTPSIIKPVYWIGSFLIVIVGIIYFFSGFGRLFTTGFFTGLWDMLAAILTVIFGILGLRIGTELCLAIFEIQDRLSAGPNSQL